MTSLTTMFVVGPNEYVEFNETWGSKAFLQHVWDQSQTPLEDQDVANGHLHSAGTRISSTSPPRIEFPTVFRVKGKGNAYKTSGRYISWDELARMNPMAVKPPPSLEEFKASGAQVGSGPRLKPGELISREDPATKLKKKSKATTDSASQGCSEQDGWIGGSSESIYASKNPPISSPSSPHKSQTPSLPVTPVRNAERSPKQSKLLIDRIDMQHTTPPPLLKQTDIRSSLARTPSPGIRRPGAKMPVPLLLTSPARVRQPLSPSTAHTPLSASHPPPETPLKLSQRNGPQTPATPHFANYTNANAHEDSIRTSGLGLGLTPHKPSVPLAHLGSPDAGRISLHEPLILRSRLNATSPSKTRRSSIGNASNESYSISFPQHQPSSTASAGNQIEAMLERLRKARSGLGTEASVWAPKSDVGTSPSILSVPLASSSSFPHSLSSKPLWNATASATIASSTTSSSKLDSALGLTAATDDSQSISSSVIHKRPGHRQNGLQLSLGQEIGIMHNLDERAEDALVLSRSPAICSSNPLEKSQVGVSEDGWYGTVVPPTPVLGFGSPNPDRDALGDGIVHPSNDRSLHHSLWSSSNMTQANTSRSNLLSPSFSSISKLQGKQQLDANWSGDDDDEDYLSHDQEPHSKAQKEIQNFLGSRSKFVQKDKDRNSNTNDGLHPLPPLHRSRSPSPKPSQFSETVKPDAKVVGRKVSPLLRPKHLEESDADTDEENEDDNFSSTSKRSHTTATSSLRRSPVPKPLVISNENSEDATSSLANLDLNSKPKPAGKRDKTERKRGRRASHTKDEQPTKHTIVATTTSERLSMINPAADVGEEEESSATSGKATEITESDNLTSDMVTQSTTEVKPKAGVTQLTSKPSATEVPLSSDVSTPVGDGDNLEKAVSIPVASHNQQESQESASIDLVEPVDQVADAIETIKLNGDLSRDAPSPPHLPIDLQHSPSEDLGGPTESADSNSKAQQEQESLTPSIKDTDSIQPLSGEGEPHGTMPHSESGFDWAEDDDELDDTLPDLDDWGVTVTASKSSSHVSQSAVTSVDAVSSGHKMARSSSSSSKEDKRNKARETVSNGGSEKPPGVNGRGNGNQRLTEPAAREMGIRIAGRAKQTGEVAELKRGMRNGGVDEVTDALVSASLSSSSSLSSPPTQRKELLQGVRYSMHAPKDGGGMNSTTNGATTASSKSVATTTKTTSRLPLVTPYGRWKTQQTERESNGISIRGTGSRWPSSSSAAGATSTSNTDKDKMTFSSIAPLKRERPAIRPRLAADSGAFARLVGSAVTAGSSASSRLRESENPTATTFSDSKDPINSVSTTSSPLGKRVRARGGKSNRRR